MTAKYPIDEIIRYQDDKEYRACIRRVFNMVCHALVSGNTMRDWDETTLDEYDHDQETMAKFLDNIYNATATIPLFHDLYITAAGFMFSEDPSIGLAVLFSYDYFALFHCVLSDFFRGDVALDSQTMSVCNLKKKMAR